MRGRALVQVCTCARVPVCGAVDVRARVRSFCLRVLPSAHLLLDLQDELLRMRKRLRHGHQHLVFPVRQRAGQCGSPRKQMG
eukprot:4400784-Pleurochrysis_carterae.AAC.1